MNKEKAIKEFKELFPEHTNLDLIMFEHGYETAKHQMVTLLIKYE